MVDKNIIQDLLLYLSNGEECSGSDSDESGDLYDDLPEHDDEIDDLSQQDYPMQKSADGEYYDDEDES